ncbi:hypothetical protein CAPTEDRAFT_198376 [Capitella teleta]|uniref:C2H2-type domain-containing protein n=1 Tax=Capitella teleta TaxID=283909 RepID=R7T8J4_CAPTE|nr:hypothetical protein CAPTEDRAFT_198376 [Capitella teleta]|eukprot:ELT89960.1 hypothetical protein CAPTEDRAFT_198376 [Capitella teleta]
MHLDLYKDRHFSLISNIASYTKTYRCIRCGKYFKTHKQVNRHLRTCGSAVRLIYPGGAYSPAKSIFEEVKEYLGMEFSKEDSVYPYRITYDFECMFKYDDVPLRSENTEWRAKHIPVSVSLCSNVESFREPKCFLSERHDTDATALIHSMIKYMLDIQEEASRLLHEKYSAVLDRLDMELCAVNHDSNKKLASFLKSLKAKFDRFLSEMIVVGFNSGKYDLNVIKKQLVGAFAALNEKVIFVVRKNNNYVCIKTHNLKILDIVNYLAPGFSYAKYLKAFNCSVMKGYFPYEWLDSYDKFAETSLPPKSAFYSTLTKTGISDEGYNYCKDVWEKNGMSTFPDFSIITSTLNLF